VSRNVWQTGFRRETTERRDRLAGDVGSQPISQGLAAAGSSGSRRASDGASAGATVNVQGAGATMSVPIVARKEMR